MLSDPGVPGAFGVLFPIPALWPVLIKQAHSHRQATSSDVAAILCFDYPIIPHGYFSKIGSLLGSLFIRVGD